MNAATADFAATAPWGGITGKPSTFPSSPALLSQGSATEGSLLVWDASAGRWSAITLQQLKTRLDAL